MRFTRLLPSLLLLDALALAGDIAAAALGKGVFARRGDGLAGDNSPPMAACMATSNCSRG